MMYALKDILQTSFGGEWGNDCSSKQGIAVLRTTNFKNTGDVSYDNVVERDISDEKVQKKKLLIGDIILEKSGGTKKTPVGRVVYFDRSDRIYLCNNFTQVLRPNLQIVDGKYLFYCLFTKYQFRATDGLYNKTTGIQNLQMDRYYNLQVPVVEMIQQRMICNQLDFLRTAIERKKQVLQKFDDLVKSQFIEMFGDLQANPKRWSFSPLNMVCDVRDGTHDSPKYCSEGYPLMTSKNFSNGEVDFSDVNFISQEDFDAINKRSKVDVGDVVMPMIGTIGHPVIVNTDKPFAIKNVALIKFGSRKVSNVFIKAVMDSDYFATIIKAKNRGNTQKFIALGDIRNVGIPNVPFEVQNQFAAFVEQTEKSKFAIKQSLEKLEACYKALLQKYFG